MQLGVPAQVNGGAGRAGCVRTHPCQLRGVVPTWRSPSIGPWAATIILSGVATFILAGSEESKAA